MQELWNRALGFEVWLNGLRGRQKFYFFLAVLAISVPLYLYGASKQLANINNHNYWVDQDAYINYARRLAQTDYTYIGDFNRMPLYPYLVSFLYEKGLTENDYFYRAKVFNIALSVGLLMILMVIYVASFDPLPALNLWLLTAFMVYIFKAAYVQVELTFYTFYFMAFILMLKLLVRPSWKLALLTGLWLGVCHLTKNSVLPGLAMLCVFMMVKTLTPNPLSNKRAGENQSPPLTPPHLVERGMRRMAYPLACVGLMLVMFLAVIWPYIHTAKKTFGHYFYNVNTTFYVWYDSWEEAEAGVRLHGDYYQWPDMPEDQLPSMQKYLRDHTPEQIARRFIYGFYVSAQRHTYRGGYGYTWYLMAYLVATGVFMRRAWQRERRTALRQKMREYRALLVFLAAFFTAYLFLFAFYVEIHPGQRFMLTLLLPAMYCLTMLLHLPVFQNLNTRVGGMSVATVRVFNLIILGALVIHGLLNAVYAAGVIHGGG